MIYVVYSRILQVLIFFAKFMSSFCPQNEQKLILCQRYNNRTSRMFNQLNSMSLKKIPALYNDNTIYSVSLWSPIEWGGGGVGTIANFGFFPIPGRLLGHPH